MTLESRLLLSCGSLLLLAGPALAQPAFTSRTDQRFGDLAQPAAVAAGDFVNTGDGVIDLAVTWFRDDAVSILQNDGTGRFVLARRLDAPDPDPGGSLSLVGDGPVAILAIDLDGDGLRDDVAGTNSGSNRFFAYENGGGSWMPADSEASRGSGYSATVGDWASPLSPADGCDDLFTASEGGIVTIALSLCDGSGEFEVVNRFAAPGEVGVQTDVELGDFVELGGDAGQLDVLTIDRLSRKIVIWPGNPAYPVWLDAEDPGGGSALVTKPVFADGLPARPVQALARDWDADGFLDLLVLLEEGHVAWYRGTRDPAQGGFEDPIVTDLAGPLGEGPRPATRFSSMAYEDLVGADGASAPDGIPDLVIADAGHAAPDAQGFNWLLLVPGTAPAPGFDDPPEFAVDAQSHFAAADLGAQRPGSLAVADFDGDSDADVVLLAFDASALTLFRNDGTGGLDAARSFSAGAGGLRGLAARSEDGGRPAGLVLAATEIEALSTLESDGGGRLVEPGLLSASSGESGAGEVKLLDLDGDSILDALVSFRDEHVSFPGLADGSYDAPVVLADGPRSLRGLSRSGHLGPNGAPDAADLAVFPDGFGEETLQIWLGDGAGGFTHSAEVAGLAGYSTHAIAAVVEGTGRDSVVVAGQVESFPSPPVLRVVAHEAGGSWSVHSTVGFPAPYDSVPDSVGLLVPGDFDEDGHADVVAVLGGGAAFLLRGDGTRLTPPSASFAWLGGARAGLAADMGGGRADLVIAQRSTVSVVPNLGGSFGAPLVLPSNLDNVAVDVLDLDGDGLAEILVGSQGTHDVTVFRNLSTTPFVLVAGPTPAGECCRFGWPAVDGALYSLLRGNLSTLWGDRTLPLLDVTETPCAATGLVDNWWDEAGALPPAAAGYPPVAFFLVRCEGGDCAQAGFGADSFGVARYANDPPDPCP